MNLAWLLQVVGDEPVFETGLLLAGNVCRADVERQLSRWTRAGRILQLRRGLYSLAPPYRKVEPAALEGLAVERLRCIAERAASPKLGRAAARITELLQRDEAEYEEP